MFVRLVDCLVGTRILERLQVRQHFDMGKQRVLISSIPDIGPLANRILRAEDPEKMLSLLEKLNAC